MKLKTRIIVGFGMSILVPLLLFSATLYGLGHTKFAQQTKDSSEVVYDISVGESTHSQTQVRIIAKDLYSQLYLLDYGFTEVLPHRWLN